MVNKRSRSTRSLLLEQLRLFRGAPVSGEKLAAALGVSRVAIWKAVKSLKEAGYPIEAEGQGYRIGQEAQNDSLHPWEFGDHESLVHHWDTTTSTMDRARELAERGAPSGTLVVAEVQSAGRGRSGRRWESVSGGLFFTLLIAQGGPILRYASAGMRATAAVADAIAGVTGKGAELRWPNDVYVGNRKIAGILTEIQGEGDRLNWSLLGIGVNVNNPGDGSRTTSCGELTGHSVSRRDVLDAFIASIGRLSVLEGASLAGEWNARAFGRGSRVGILPASHDEGKDRRDLFGAGIFAGIDEFGRALIRTDRGTELHEPGATSVAWDL